MRQFRDPRGPTSVGLHRIDRVSSDKPRCRGRPASARGWGECGDGRLNMPVTLDQEDRSITIQATPTLNYDMNEGLTSVTFSYEETDSRPNMQNVVNEQTGDIDLTRLPPNAKYTDNVDVIINLVTSIPLPNGNSITVNFAPATPSPGAIWFCAVPPPGGPKDPTPIATPAGMSIGENTASQVYLNDDQADGGSDYCFCMAVVVPSLSSSTYTIDPIVTGKGTNSSFMLSK